MTPQEMFNIVWTGIHKQGGLSYKNDGTCLYLNPDNARCCAAGLVFREMGASDQRLLSLQGPSGAAIWQLGMSLPEEALGFINKLQRIHDDTVLGFRWNFDLLKVFEAKMRQLAAEQNLEIPC
jgi:hypothetical protein